MNRILAIIFSVWFSMLTFGQVTFVAQAPKSVDVESQFRLKYVLQNADGSDFKAPSFADFEVLAGPSVSQYSDFQIINGHSSSKKSITYTYILQPKKSGSFRIPAATIKADGKIYRSQMLMIAVHAGSGSSSQGRNNIKSDDDDDDFAFASQQRGPHLSKNDLYFTVGATKRQVYEQEPIMLTYKFHSRVGVRLANVMLRQKPDLKGFWTQEVELPRNLSPTTERVGNSLYRVGTNLQYVIFPQKTGKLDIPGITFDCDVLHSDHNIDEIDAFFNGGGQISRRVSCATDNLTIDVLPLPQPQPAGFSGGVGQFTAKTQLLTPSLQTNDIATLRFTISGSGNMKLIKAPAIVFPKDFDTYDPKMTDKTRVSVDGITGEVYYDYTFVPRNVGEYDIPEADFIFFDTQKRSYVTLHTQALHLDVKKGKRSKEDVEAEMAMRNSDIRDIHQQTSSFAPFETGWDAGAGWIGSVRYFITLLVIIVASCIVLRFFGRRKARRSDVAGMRNRGARRKANKHLQKAAKVLTTNDHGAFYAALATALRGYFADKLARNAAALTNEEIISELSGRQVPLELVDGVRHLLEDCDFARFAPAGDSTQLQHDFQRATDLIDNLEAHL